MPTLPVSCGLRKLAAEVIDIICQYNFSGDVAAFGLESADPAVLAANRVETTPEETLAAVRLMNEIGGRREQGIPKLLPDTSIFSTGCGGKTGGALEDQFSVFAEPYG